MRLATIMTDYLVGPTSATFIAHGGDQGYFEGVTSARGKEVTKSSNTSRVKERDSTERKKLSRERIQAIYIP